MMINALHGKKLLLAFALILGLGTAAFSQGCVIDTGNYELIYPPTEGLHCIERGVPYQATIQFFCLPAIGGFTLDSLYITTFLDLPTGITYQLNPAPCKLYPYDHGCIQLSGTTNDTSGAYIVDYNGFVYTSQGNPSFDWLKVNFGGVLPEYSMRVIESGAACPNTPSGVAAVHRAPALSVFPNPSNGIFQVALDAANSDATLTVSDATGRQVYEQSFSAAATSAIINLSTYPRGIYLLRLRTDNGVSEKKVSVE